MNACAESEQYPEQFVFLTGQSTIGKSKAIRLPSRLPVTIDVNISGSATVKLYASNITDDPASAAWGTAVRTFSASEKIVIQDEPWLWFYVEVSAITSGAVTVVAGG